MIPDKKHINQFVHFLTSQEGPAGRALMAQLRRAATGPDNTVSMIWLLGSKLPDTDGPNIEAYGLVASLYALHAPNLWEQADGKEKLKNTNFFRADDQRSFGVTLRQLRSQMGTKEEHRASFDMRVKALIDTRSEDLAIPLRGMIQRIATPEKRAVPIDYAQLLTDLIEWEDGDEVRRRWSREYWSQYVPAEKSADEESIDNQTTTA